MFYRAGYQGLDLFDVADFGLYGQRLYTVSFNFSLSLKPRFTVHMVAKRYVGSLFGQVQGDDAPNKSNR